MVSLSGADLRNGLRCEVVLLKGGPFVLPIYEMRGSRAVGLARELQRGNDGCLYRAVALNDREYLQVVQVGLLAGVQREKPPEPRSALATAAPIADRIAEYVNGVVARDAKGGGTGNDLSVYKPRWPGDSTVVGLYRNPLQAMTVGTATGLRKLMDGAARLYLFRVAPRGCVSVTAAIRSARVVARYSTEGEYVMEGAVQPQAISGVFVLDPSFHGAYEDSHVLVTVYPSFMARLAGTGDRSHQNRCVSIITHRVQRESRVLSRSLHWFDWRRQSRCE